MCILRLSNICKEERLLNECRLGVIAFILPSPRVKKYTFLIFCGKAGGSCAYRSRPSRGGIRVEAGDRGGIHVVPTHRSVFTNTVAHVDETFCEFVVYR